MFERRFDPTLVYVASDELNILFLSVVASLISYVFTLRFLKLVDKNCVVTYDFHVILSQLATR